MRLASSAVRLASSRLMPAAGGCERLAQTAAGRVAGAERMRLLEGGAQVTGVELQVRARAFEPGIIEEPAELLGGQCTKARGLHFAETDLPDRPQRRRRMRLQFVFDRVQL